MVAQLVNTMLGIWLMAAPAVLGYAGPADTNDRIIGPLIATFALVAAWGVLRPLRWVNLPLGLWLVAARLILGFELTPAINSVATGAAVIALSCIRGRINHPYGGGWSSLWRGDPDVCPPPGTSKTSPSTPGT